MTSLHTRTGGTTLTRTSLPPAAVEVADPVDHATPVDGVSARHQREITLLAQHLRKHHPAVPLPEITSMVEDELAALAGSRVQGFRMILAERAVRRRLASEGERAST